MNYLSVDYVVFSALLLLIYYCFSRVRSGRFQWIVLLLGSIFFYYTWTKEIGTLLLFLIPVVSSYLGGLLLDKEENKAAKRKITCIISIIFIILPLIIFKIQGFLPDSLVVPVGISFYTLQLIAYVVDCYRRKCCAQRNPLKHLLFVTFFPHIIQGPIPRYKELGEQLFQRHSFEYTSLSKGMLRIVWGFFLKLMIADKAAVIVNKVFNGNGKYVGGYIIVAAILYAIQLYTDFYACTSMSIGVARLFGVELSENFCRPYFATSVKDFWRRWHISLSTWLRDYIYIPLGGNKRGKINKYINIILVFYISGLWHGSQLQFVVWGLLHAVYQIFGDLSFSIRERIYEWLKIRKGSIAYNSIKRIGVFFWVTVGWVFFRSEDAAQGMRMIHDAFSYINPWTILGTEFFSLGLDYHEIWLLLASIVVLILIGFKQEHGADIQEWYVNQHLLVRWSLLFAAIVVIWVFGTYGYGFNAQDFIYGGF